MPLTLAVLILVALRGTQASRIQPSKAFKDPKDAPAKPARSLPTGGVLRNVTPHQQELHDTRSISGSLVQSMSEITIATLAKSWFSSLADPTDDSAAHGAWKASSRPMLVVGITAFLVLVLCGSCWMMERFVSRCKKASKRSSGMHSASLPEEGTTSRSQHYHDSRLIYEWDQTATLATIYIRPPDGVQKKDLDIKISSKVLRVGRKGKPPFLREEIYATVHEEASSWRLRSSGELQIHLPKVHESVWPYVLCHKKEDRTSTRSHSRFGSSWLRN